MKQKNLVKLYSKLKLKNVAGTVPLHLRAFSIYLVDAMCLRAPRSEYRCYMGNFTGLELFSCSGIRIPP